MDRLSTTTECDLELVELGKALRLVSRRSRPVVMKRIDQVLDRRLLLDRGDQQLPVVRFSPVDPVIAGIDQPAT